MNISAEFENEVTLPDTYALVTLKYPDASVNEEIVYKTKLFGFDCNDTLK